MLSRISYKSIIFLTWYQIFAMAFHWVTVCPDFRWLTSFPTTHHSSITLFLSKITLPRRSLLGECQALSPNPKSRLFFMVPFNHRRSLLLFNHKLPENQTKSVFVAIFQRQQKPFHQSTPSSRRMTFLLILTLHLVSPTLWVLSLSGLVAMGSPPTPSGTFFCHGIPHSLGFLPHPSSTIFAMGFLSHPGFLPHPTLPFICLSSSSRWLRPCLAPKLAPLTLRSSTVPAWFYLTTNLGS